jgi:RNA 2',3'-cyclic 3'-phosphodiesterase
VLLSDGLPAAVAGRHTAAVRLFVALDVPPAATGHLEGAVAAVREQHAGLRWIPADRLHLTLAFLGEVREPALDPLSQRLERVCARHQEMSLCFAGAGRFGSRVLWVGVSGDLTPLSRLAQSVGAAARKAGVVVDERVHRPHVTLARSRTTSLDLRPVVAALADYEGPAWRAASFSLVRSYLGPQPRYEVLRGFRLRAASAPA